MREEQNSPAEGTCRPANSSLLCLPVDECFLFGDGLYFVATLTLAECHRASPVQYWLCTCWPCSSTHRINTSSARVVTLPGVCVCAREILHFYKKGVNVLRGPGQRGTSSKLRTWWPQLWFSLRYAVNKRPSQTERICVRACNHIARW